MKFEEPNEGFTHKCFKSAGELRLVKLFKWTYEVNFSYRKNSHYKLQQIIHVVLDEYFQNTFNFKVFYLIMNN